MSLLCPPLAKLKGKTAAHSEITLTLQLIKKYRFCTVHCWNRQTSHQLEFMPDGDVLDINLKMQVKSQEDVMLS